MAKMTGRERLLKTISHEEPDSVWSQRLYGDESQVSTSVI